MNQKRVLITGYYGCGNLGDEALREALVIALGQVGIDPVVIEGRDRFRIGKLSRYIRESGGLVLGGGGLLQNRTSVRSLYYYLGLIIWARVLHRPVFLIGQGLGPINGTLAQTVTRHVLSRVDYLGVRDQESLEFAARFGISAALDGDLFFLNPPVFLDRPKLNPPRVGIALSGNTKTVGWRDSLVALSQWCTLVFIPFFPREDLPLVNSLVARIPGAEVHVPESVTDAQSLIASLNLLVSSRLHPLEFALRVGVPMVAVPHDPKITAFVSEVRALGGPEIPCCEVLTADEVRALISDPPPPELFAKTYEKLHIRTKAGFARFLRVLNGRLGGDDD